MIARIRTVLPLWIAACAFAAGPVAARAAEAKAAKPPASGAKARAVEEIPVRPAAATQPAAARRPALAKPTTRPAAAPKAATRAKPATPVKIRRVRYRPRRRGAPITREASAARSLDDPLPNVTVLAPPHTGLTTRAEPMFAWHQDGPARAEFILTLTNEKTFETLMALKLNRASPAGVGAFDLSDVGLSLEAGVDHKWSVGLTSGKEHASGDPYSAARVTRVAPSAELTRQLRGADALRRASIFAEHGIWYDALAELCGLIRALPDDGALEEVRRQFLKDAGVLEAPGGAERSGKPRALDRPAAAAKPRPTTRPARAPRTQPAEVASRPAATTKPTTPRVVTSRPARVRTVRYRPPKRGAPATRETSASRRTDVALPNVRVLAPKHTALTSRAHPVLAWHQDAAARATFVLTLTKADELDTMLELKVMKRASAGFHRFDLARLDLALEAGAEYRWSIGVIAEDEHASGDPYSSARIRRVAASDELASALAGAGKLERVAILAAHGIWYDALAELSDLIEARPGDRSLLELRTRLLADAEVFEAEGKSTAAAPRTDR